MGVSLLNQIAADESGLVIVMQSLAQLAPDDLLPNLLRLA
jgi:hypothetical protein